MKVPTTMQTQPEKLVYTLQESAALLALSTKSIARLIKRGKLRCMSSVRHKRIPRSELTRFLKEDLN
jgi:excisionase family DNA binding protein